ncbi:NAD(P)/FAD-dependent oxidoreductase [Microbacterium betulae]|uniref:NAD(P)/FAD-dependent oxidoreductase n=1 Tax=Microbacterium betulae TaxID=2981139 RepID=A0AA97I7G4_9MICO|nr:NAD(P)/FAD-dependent oxidoreductase [Microbacterium sp. AB]WOF23400.1 NAD(P)/FAD-dependent oxidoreductase [Microbacterium sp. AB]
MTATGTVIVGAGFAGIAAALALRAQGVDDFVILERASAVGGTWRDNTYPGVACDVPSHLYGLSAHPWPEWSHVFAPGAEIRAYLERIVRREGLERHLRLATPMLDARWDGEEWAIRTGRAHNAGIPERVAPVKRVLGPSADGIPASCADDELRASHLVLACGRLTEPRIPDLPGLESFGGPIFHSSRWDHTVDVPGRRIAVVGTGASAVQLVPALAAAGADVVLFQRTPAWIVPKRDRVYSEAERDALRDPDEAARLRERLYDDGEARFASRSGDAVAAAEAETAARAHLAAQVGDPALRDALTPSYAFGCKRVLLSDDFYPAVASGSVDLVPSALSSVSDGALVAADGSRHDADVVVLATGFASTRQPWAPLVAGAHGLTLEEHWADGMTSVGSTLVHGFPNLFVLGGPNAALGHNSAVLIVEEQAAFAAALIRDGAFVHATSEAEAAYTREIVERSAATPWVAGGCDNWYVDERSGRLTLLWPGTVAAFRERLARVRNELTDLHAAGTNPAAPALSHEGAAP